MNPQRLATILCLLLIVAALGGRMLGLPDEVDPGRPRAMVRAPELLAAAVPPIGDFEKEFHINDLNPFVPIREREDEFKTKQRVRTPTPVEVKPKIDPPVKGPVVVTPPEPEKPGLPKRTAEPKVVPECLGVVSHGGTGSRALLARLPGQTQVTMQPGAEIAGWTLLEVGFGVARFRDPTGFEQTLPIGGAPPENAEAIEGSSLAPVVVPPVVAPPTTAKPPVSSSPRPLAPPVQTTPDGSDLMSPKRQPNRPMPQAAPEMVPLPTPSR